MSEEKKRIMFLVPPASGHINPLASIASEINKRSNGNVHILFFGTAKYQSLIERTGSEYRQLSSADMDNVFRPSTDKSWSIALMLKSLMQISADELPLLIKTCNEFKPHLIVYDMLTLFAKYLLNYFHVNKDKLSFPIPKDISVCPSFAMYEDIYPSKEETALLFGKMSMDILKELPALQEQVNKKYELDYKYDFASMFQTTSKLNLCCVFTELQPCSEKLKEKFHFVGCCIDEHVRSVHFTNEKLKNILETFDSINPINLNNSKKLSSSKLVYASLGTVFNFDINTFEKIIESIRKFDDVVGANLKSSDLQVVISLGNDIYEKYMEKIRSEKYRVPDNVLLMESVPQIEILKRAHLYITHAGMNSTSETIHFGVPVICIPQQGDQPLVAKRISDELKFGIRLDNETFTAEQLRDAIHEVLENKTYQKNILEYSSLSRKYNGCLNATNLILNYLE